jgi:hypothetical protein
MATLWLQTCTQHKEEKTTQPKNKQPLPGSLDAARLLELQYQQAINQQAKEQRHITCH